MLWLHFTDVEAESQLSITATATKSSAPKAHLRKYKGDEPCGCAVCSSKQDTARFSSVFSERWDPVFL